MFVGLDSPQNHREIGVMFTNLAVVWGASYDNYTKTLGTNPITLMLNIPMYGPNDVEVFIPSAFGAQAVGVSTAMVGGDGPCHFLRGAFWPHRGRLRRQLQAVDAWPQRATGEAHVFVEGILGQRFVEIYMD